MESENPSDHQRLKAADGKKKRKQEIDKKSREKKKKTQESKEAQLKTLQDSCNYYRGQVDFCEKSMIKPLLDEACQIRKLLLEPGESSGHTKETVEKQTDLVNVFWDLLKKPQPGGRTCDSTSASTDKDAYPPLELSVAAIKSDGSVMTESFKPCQSLPEEWTHLAEGGHERLIRAFFGLREHYTATTARHAREMAKRDHELAQEMAKRDHELAQEIAKRDVELIGDRIGKTLKVDRATSVGMRGNFARVCVEVDLTKPLLAKFKLRRRIGRIVYEGLHLICFQCGQYGHKQELCPHAQQNDQEVAKDMDLPGVSKIPIVRPEIVESYGTWMIAERITRRLNKGKVVEPTVAAGMSGRKVVEPTVAAGMSGRKVVEPTVAAGRSGDHTRNSGGFTTAIKDSQVSISTRYDALMANGRDTVIRGAPIIKEGDNSERGTIEIKNNKERGWLVGHKQHRALSGPGEKNMGKATGKDGLHNEEMRILAANRQPNLHPKDRVSTGSERGKEKMEDYGLSTKYIQITRTLSEKPCNVPHLENMQMMLTDSNGYKEDTVMVHMPEDRNLEPDPPDATLEMEERRMGSTEEDRGKRQSIPEGNTWMEEGEVRKTQPC